MYLDAYIRTSTHTHACTCIYIYINVHNKAQYLFSVQYMPTTTEFRY